MRRLAWLVFGLVAATACGAGSQPPPVTFTQYQLTCCAEADIDHAWQPGTTVELHWIVMANTVTTVNPSHKAVSTAQLLGPFSDVDTLKHATAGQYVVQGSIVAIDDRVPPATPPVSVFILPADLPAGYYQLNIHTDLGDGTSLGSGSIVQVRTP
ncbi:MAG TPA: hypothetical protein VFR33_01625 [Candidatus Dormibacteraeota bacterium]|nr:hypothetical protein [Candidatus Dormibacteraeota bacterium]